MTKHIKILTGLATLLAAVAACAQSSNAIRVDVPFPFVTAGKSWPAATYNLQIQANSGILTLSLPGVSSAMALTNRYQRPGEVGSSLRFQHAGDRWFLTEVSLDGTAHVLLTGELEKELTNEHLSVEVSAIQ